MKLIQNAIRREKNIRNSVMKPHIEIVCMWRILNLKWVFIIPTAHIHISIFLPWWLLWMMKPRHSNTFFSLAVVYSKPITFYTYRTMKLPKKVVNEEEANTIRLLLANWIIETIIATMYVLMKVYDQIANNIFFYKYWKNNLRGRERK